MDRDRFEKQLKFILEIDQEKNIFRQTHLTHMGRAENDSEHAWHMAIMLYLLKEYANEEFDLAKAMMMALIHDIVEIDAGDTYAYDEKGKATEKEREEKAAERIFGLLPEDQGDKLKALFKEYEALETPEARIVRSMDNLQPLLLNDSNDGADWKRRKVGITQVKKRHQETFLGSKELGEFAMELLDKNVKNGNIENK